MSKAFGIKICVVAEMSNVNDALHMYNVKHALKRKKLSWTSTNGKRLHVQHLHKNINVYFSRTISFCYLLISQQSERKRKTMLHL